MEVSLGLTYWLKPLGDAREQYKDLQAVMMGPYVMAGVESVGVPGAVQGPAGSHMSWQVWKIWGSVRTTGSKYKDLKAVMMVPNCGGPRMLGKLRYV